MADKLSFCISFYESAISDQLPVEMNPLHIVENILCDYTCKYLNKFHKSLA